MESEMSRISFKIGDVEISLESKHRFSMDDVSNIIGMVSDVSMARAASMPPTDKPDGRRVPNGDMSTATIAARLKADSGPDLAIASAARLTIFDGKGSFSRADLLTAMKQASGRYKVSMASNLSSTLRGLVKNGRLNETGSGTYALTATEREALESTLAGQP